MLENPPLFRFSLAQSSVAIAWFAIAVGSVSAQEPPGIEAAPSQPKLNLRELFSGGNDAGGNHVRFTGSFTIEKGSRSGTLTLAAKIDPDWHVYSITQPSG